MQELLIFLKKNKGKAISFFELLNFFGENVKDYLDFLKKEGKIVEIKKNYFVYIENTPYIIGKVFFKGKNLFVETKYGDFYFPSNQLKLMEGDLVLIKKEKGRAKILKIIERKEKKLIGFYLGEKNFVPLKRLNSEFQLIKPLNLPHGSIIETEIALYPQRKRKGIVEFKNFIGNFGCTKEEIYAFCLSRDLRFHFPEEVLKEAEKFSKSFEMGNRVDLREKEIFTIDPSDAKDFDDAVSLEEENGFYVLGVHIADVTHYVKEGSKIDKEAVLRGETLYFPTYAVHMLPPKLSEEICSLKENKDRLTISVFAFFDKKGKHIKTEFKETVIRSKKRFNYLEVEEILEGKNSNFSKTLKKMENLSKILKEKRLKRGSLEFEFPEFEFQYDENGNLKGVFPLERLKSHSIIEEFMLFANKEVARFLWNKNYPFLFRIHQKPDPLKLEELKIIFKRYGFDFKVNLDNPTPKMIQKILNEIKKEKDCSYLQEMLLRSLPRAIYSPKRDIHFALNFQNYCHFTSPIRRYADIIVHRALKNALKGKKYETKNLEELAENLNKRAKEKEEIEREFLEYKILQLLKGKEGEILEGVIESVIDSGIFIFLPKYFISGFMPFSFISNIYFIPDKTFQSIRVSGKNLTYKLRDEVIVRIKEINPFKRFLRLDLIKKK